MSFANFVFSETSPAAAGTAASSQKVQGGGTSYPAGVAAPIDEYESHDIVAELVGATGGTLDVYVQTSHDGGVNWYDKIHFAQLADGAAAVIYRTSTSNAQNGATPQAVGKNLSPQLGNNVTLNGPASDRMRLLMVAGAGTSAGAKVIVKVTSQHAGR